MTPTRTRVRMHVMTKVSIMPVPNAEGTTSYCAVAGDKYSRGDTAGKALDALSAQLSQAESGTLVVVQNLRADQFFNGPQQQRLGL